MVTPYASGIPQDPTPRSRWPKALMISLAVFGFGVVAFIGFLIFLGSYGLDTKAVPGANLPLRHLETIRGLGLIEEGEKIRYFYSDAVFDVRGGMYFFTDKKVVVYDDELPEVPIVVPFDQITDIKADLSDSFWEDGLIWIRRADDEISFPIPEEGGRRFFEVLTETWKKRFRS